MKYEIIEIKPGDSKDMFELTLRSYVPKEVLVHLINKSKSGFFEVEQ